MPRPAARHRQLVERARTPRISSSAPSGWRHSPTISSKRPSSTFSSTASGSCSRSATTSSTGGSTTPTTTSLASEARLASFVAIAIGQVPHEHWFKLGRSLTPTGTSRALLSWSASMFEYLMPLLVMRAYPGTLLDETYHAVVERQIEYARAARRAVGHLRVGLQRAGPRRQLSVPRLRRARPRAQARPGRRPGDRAVRQHAGRAARRRATSREPRAAARARAWPGRYGFYEAIDYTPDRLPPRHSGGVVLRDLHGAPPGHEPGGARQRAARRPDAAPLPRRPARPGRRAAAAGADPAPGAAEEPADREGRSRAVDARRDRAVGRAAT